MRTVRDIMKTDLIFVRLGTSVEELIHLLDEEGISGVPVLDASNRIRGVVSRTDVIRMAARGQEDTFPDAFWSHLTSEPGDEDDPSGWFLSPESPSAVVVPAAGFAAFGNTDMTVDDIMTPVAFTVDPDMLIWELADFLVKGRIHRALVVENGALVGIATAFDLLRVMAGDAST
jgi:CBS domain-containing protein